MSKSGCVGWWVGGWHVNKETHKMLPFAQRPPTDSTRVTARATCAWSAVMLYAGTSQLPGSNVNTCDTAASETVACPKRYAHSNSKLERFIICKTYCNEVRRDINLRAETDLSR